MSDKHTVAYKPGEKTRWFAVGSGDIFLCKEMPKAVSIAENNLEFRTVAQPA
jgi:hypothetical protein